MTVNHEICGMQTLVIAATKKEIELFHGDNVKMDILITGMGVPAAMYELQKKITATRYDLIIQAGIAGSFDDDILPGSTVVVKRDTFADLGMEVQERFTSIFHSGFIDPYEFPYTDGWLVNDHPLIDQLGLNAVNSVTVNKVSDSLLQKRQLTRTFSPQVESMEGAALHYVCLREEIPFIQIRAISNHVGDRDRANWKMRESISNLNTALRRLIAILDPTIQR